MVPWSPALPPPLATPVVVIMPNSTIRDMHIIQLNKTEGNKTKDIACMVLLRRCCRIVPVSDAHRYERGEIWWYENGDDIAQLSTKIQACQMNAVNATRFTRRVGCYVQRAKLRARRSLVKAVKKTAKYMVESYFSLRDALTGPRGTFVDGSRGELGP